MSPDVALVLVAVIGIIVPVFSLFVKFVQDRRIANEARNERAQIAQELEERGRITAAAVAAVRAELSAQQSNANIARRDITAAVTTAAVQAEETGRSVQAVRTDLAQQHSGMERKLDTVIVGLGNGRLEHALRQIDMLTALLLQLAPADPRVVALPKKDP